jgi:hypothetical protein
LSPRAKLEIKEQLREYVQRSVTNLGEARQAIRAQLKEIFGLESAPGGMASCLLYLQLFVGEDVHTRELEVVSGISEYARRLRELRVEKGYEIYAEQRRDGWWYCLRSVEPDSAKASRWKEWNKIRHMKGSGESRVLAAFKASLRIPVDIDDLDYVSKIKTARERARDLRLHKGWRIFGHHTGRPDLRVTEYVLESLDQLPEHDRKIPDEIYEAVLEADKYHCRKCGWDRSKRVQGSRKQFLEVHHKKLHSKGGSHEPKNLVTLCNMHHDEVHRRKLDETTIDGWLKNGKN